MKGCGRPRRLSCDSRSLRSSSKSGQISSTSRTTFQVPASRSKTWICAGKIAQSDVERESAKTSKSRAISWAFWKRVAIGRTCVFGQQQQKFVKKGEATEECFRIAKQDINRNHRPRGWALTRRTADPRTSHEKPAGSEANERR
eukprot:4516726-Pleurochrysis_carterae.AAC.4